jgi:Tol biopolymer transport system component
MKKNIFKLKKWILRSVFLLAVLNLFMLISCDKKEVLEPEGPQLPELTDAIPYDKLGSGTIVFERMGLCYVIDVNQRKTWSLYFPLATNYCVSPDGKKVAFTMYSGTGSVYDVYSVNIDGTNLERLDALDGQDRFPSWSPDGSKIFFWVDSDLPLKLYSQSPVPNATDLKVIREFTIQLEPGGTKFIAPSGAVSVSSTGKIAFVVPSGWSLAGLYTMDMDGKNLKLIVPVPRGRNFESPVFSPDGQKIAYLSVLRDSQYVYKKIEIMQVNTDGGSPVLLASLTANGSKEWADNGKDNSVYLTCSPDGSKFLVNIPEGDFVSHLYLLNADGSNLTQVTFAEGVTDRCVSWGR